MLFLTAHYPLPTAYQSHFQYSGCMSAKRSLKGRRISSHHSHQSATRKFIPFVASNR